MDKTCHPTHGHISDIDNHHVHNALWREERKYSDGKSGLSLDHSLTNSGVRSANELKPGKTFLSRQNGQESSSNSRSHIRY